MQDINLIIALTVFQIQLQSLLPPNPGPVLFSADLGNTNATMATVFTSGMCVMVLMTVEITQMNGFVVCIDCGGVLVSVVAMNLLIIFIAE